MCRSWKKEGCNHHFPELQRKKKMMGFIKGCLAWHKLCLLLVALTIGAGFIYLMQTNTVVSKGYKIKELENKVNNLEENNKRLKLKYVELQSMANLTGRVAQLNLVATKEVESLTPLGSAVALK